MTAHELARILLILPDIPVVVDNGLEPNNLVEVTKLVVNPPPHPYPVFLNNNKTATTETVIEIT